MLSQETLDEHDAAQAECARLALKWIELLQRFALGKGVGTDTMMRRTFKVGGRVGGGLPGTDVATIREILPGGMYVTLFCCVRTERNGRAALPCTTSKRNVSMGVRHICLRV